MSLLTSPNSVSCVINWSLEFCNLFQQSDELFGLLYSSMAPCMKLQLIASIEHMLTPL